MATLLEWLEGKKTYLVAAGIGIVAALRSAEIIDDSMAETFFAILGGGGLASMAAKVNRSNAVD